MPVKYASQWPVIAALACLTFSGCGGDPGYHISGKATFDGKPIPQGKIYFSPDNAKGNSGASGYADIKNGEYNTASGGKKHLGGAMLVKIEGFDPTESGPEVPVEASETTIKALFPVYEIKTELTKGSSTKDFDVPAKAVELKQSQPENGQPVKAGPVDGV